MPELKNTFTGGRMEKDLDERIVPRGLYREALNIDVSNSEDSDVGAAQNILGNLKVTEAIQGDKGDYIVDQAIPSCTYTPSQNVNGRYYGTNYHIASTINPQTDMIYRFVSTTPDANNRHGVWMDRIVEYNTTKVLSDLWWQKERSIFVDIYKIQTEVYEIDPLSGSFSGCDQSIIHVCTNSFQLRWGMIIRGGTISGGIPASKDVFIEKIVYNGDIAILTLSENIDGFIAQWDTISFHGDRVLNFHPTRKITGINIIDDMLFWTDNYSEPKKVNIARDRVGSNSSLYGSGWDHSGGTPRTYGCDPSGAQVCFSDFDQHTKLIVKTSVARECNKKTDACPVTGCTNPLAVNYDPFATIDDGSCTMPTYGCTDPLACNFGTFDFLCDAQAVLDGNCTNVDECDYTSCTGCTDSTAVNYDPAATIDDGSCEYYYTCVNGFQIINCNWPFNSTPRTLVGDMTITSPQTFLDYMTISMNAVDLGSVYFYNQLASATATDHCFNPNWFPTSPTGGELTIITDIHLEEIDDSGAYVQTLYSWDLTNAAISWGSIISDIQNGTGGWHGGTLDGNPDPNWNSTQANIIINLDWNALNTILNAGLVGNSYPLSRLYSRLTFEVSECNCTNEQLWSGDPNFSAIPATYYVDTCLQDDNSTNDLLTCQTLCMDHCTACQADPSVCNNGVSVVYGCTDPTAFNYNSLADCDDGNCIPILLGCTDPQALNVGNANTEDGTCIYIGCTDVNATNPSYFNHPNPGNLYTNPILATVDNGSCAYACSGNTSVPDQNLESILEGGFATGMQDGWFDGGAGNECDYTNGNNCDALFHNVNNQLQDAQGNYYNCCDWPGEIMLDNHGVADTTGLEVFSNVWKLVNKHNPMATHHVFNHPVCKHFHIEGTSQNALDANSWYDTTNDVQLMPELKWFSVPNTAGAVGSLDENTFDFGSFVNDVWTRNGGPNSNLGGFLTGAANLQLVDVSHNAVRALDLRDSPNVRSIRIVNNGDFKQLWLGQADAETLLQMSGLKDMYVDLDAVFSAENAVIFSQPPYANPGPYTNGSPLSLVSYYFGLSYVDIDASNTGGANGVTAHPVNTKIIVGNHSVTCSDSIYGLPTTTSATGCGGWNAGSDTGSVKDFCEWIGEQGGWYKDAPLGGGIITKENWYVYWDANATNPAGVTWTGMTLNKAAEFCATWDGTTCT
tara:strand:+ start:2202 stop:5762 length:3561 start_codon:yes stop_codon:yes gene_type:complete